jgi:hypothetical protein
VQNFISGASSNVTEAPKSMTLSRSNANAHLMQHNSETKRISLAIERIGFKIERVRERAGAGVSGRRRNSRSVNYTTEDEKELRLLDAKLHDYHTLLRIYENQEVDRAWYTRDFGGSGAHAASRSLSPLSKNRERLRGIVAELVRSIESDRQYLEYLGNKIDEETQGGYSREFMEWGDVRDKIDRKEAKIKDYHKLLDIFPADRSSGI